MAASSTSELIIYFLMDIDASVNVPGTVEVKRPLDGTWLGSALRKLLIGSSSADVELLRLVLVSDCIVAAASDEHGFDLGWHLAGSFRV